MCVRAALFRVCKVRSHFCNLFVAKCAGIGIFYSSSEKKLLIVNANFQFFEPHKSKIIMFFWDMRLVQKNYSKLQKCAGAKCDHHKMKVRTRVHTHLNLDVRGACVLLKNRSQLTLWCSKFVKCTNSQAQWT